MPDDGAKTVTVSQPALEVSSDSDDPVAHTMTEYVLYKLDRSMAIMGIIGIAIVSIFVLGGNEGVQIATGAVGGLVGYVGGRTGNK